MSTFTKDPASVLDYQINWSTWLVADTIATSAWVVAGSGLTIDSDTNDTTTATVWLSAGTAGKEYAVTNTITTAAGRTVSRSLTINCQDR